MRRLLIAAMAGVTLLSCQSGPTGPVPAPNPGPSPTPTAAPAPSPPTTPDPFDPARCVPVPPPLDRVHVKVHVDQGEKKILDSLPMVGPDADYCARVGFTDGRRFCGTRPEGDPLGPACDSLVMGRALDTGRIGPTWYRNDKLCLPPQSGEGGPGGPPRCQNHPTEQFLVFAFGPGNYMACSASGVCGGITIP